MTPVPRIRAGLAALVAVAVLAAVVALIVSSAIRGGQLDRERRQVIADLTQSQCLDRAQTSADVDACLTAYDRQAP